MNSNNNRNITLRLESFEGPFDLLFHLIEKNEIDIYDIPIAELTDQYIEYIKNIAARDMEGMSEFVLMASTLLEIKSKMLLPKQVTDKDEEDIDPRAELVEKLIEYKRFKSMIAIFKEKESIAEKSFFKLSDGKVIDLLQVEETVDISDILSGVTLDMLFKAFQETLSRKEMKTDKIRSSFNSVTKDLYTIEEKIEHIQNLISLYKELSFKSIFTIDSGKMEKVVTFLALLELIKMKLVDITQEMTFGEIIIKKWNAAL